VIDEVRAAQRPPAPDAPAQAVVCPLTIPKRSELRLFYSLAQQEERIDRDLGELVQAEVVGTMSFTGTQDKCNACDKTVHFIDLLTADGVIYHKTCFKCSHCKGILSVSVFPMNLASPNANGLERESKINLQKKKSI
jgi:hypothetical protein